MKKQEHVNSMYNMAESYCTLMACDLLTTWCIREVGAIAWAYVSSEYAPGSVFSFFIKMWNCVLTQYSIIYPFITSFYMHLHKFYRVIQEESAVLWEMIVCVILSKKSSYECGSDFERLPRYGKKKIGPSCEHEQQLCNKQHHN